MGVLIFVTPCRSIAIRFSAVLNGVINRDESSGLQPFESLSGGIVANATCPCDRPYPRPCNSVFALAVDQVREDELVTSWNPQPEQRHRHFYETTHTARAFSRRTGSVAGDAPAGDPESLLITARRAGRFRVV